MAKGSKSRYKLHEARQRTLEYASTDTYSSPCDVEVVRGTFRVKAKRGKIFRDGMNENKHAHNRQNGNRNHKPVKI